MILVGVGHLGLAILAYDGFQPQGFIIVDAFDSDPERVGMKVHGLVVRPASELPAYLRERQVDIGIVAVPATSAEAIIQALVAGGVYCILNYGPLSLPVPHI